MSLASFESPSLEFLNLPLHFLKLLCNLSLYLLQFLLNF
jgi:hypothetical protein